MPRFARTNARQKPLPGFEKIEAKDFGGSRLKGNAREQRPISTKRPMHLVLRSSHAKRAQSFLTRDRARRIETLVHRLGREKGVKIYRFANSGNHLHLVVLPRSREAFNAYIRALSGLVARITLGRERGGANGQENAAGRAERKIGKKRSETAKLRGGDKLRFWDSRPFTRIVEWGRDFQIACRYVRQNTLEALGFISYRPRSAKYTRRPQKLRSDSS